MTTLLLATTTLNAQANDCQKIKNSDVPYQIRLNISARGRTSDVAIKVIRSGDRTQIIQEGSGSPYAQDYVLYKGLFETIHMKGPDGEVFNRRAYDPGVPENAMAKHEDFFASGTIKIDATGQTEKHNSGNFHNKYHFLNEDTYKFAGCNFKRVFYSIDGSPGMSYLPEIGLLGVVTEGMEKSKNAADKLFGTTGPTVSLKIEAIDR